MAAFSHRRNVSTRALSRGEAEQCVETPAHNGAFRVASSSFLAPCIANTAYTNHVRQIGQLKPFCDLGALYSFLVCFLLESRLPTSKTSSIDSTARSRRRLFLRWAPVTPVLDLRRSCMTSEPQPKTSVAWLAGLFQRR